MMMSYPRVLLSTALLCLAPLHIASATAYKWVHENGETHYSQTPPTATTVEVIKIPNAAATIPAPAQNNTGSSQAPDNDAKAEDAAVRAENCASARKALETLETVENVTVKDKDGLYHRVNDEERKTRSEDARKKIDEFCTR